MPNQKLDIIKKEFGNYLDSLDISARSYKNYRSDLVHFLGWAILKIRSIGSYVESLTEIVPFLSNDLGHEYKNYMIENTVPVKTMNRRLSTLRHLSRFLVGSHVIDRDFTEGIENVTTNSAGKPTISPVFNDFKAHLEQEKVSPNTIKNYLSDIRHFLLWLESSRQTNQPAN
jgi:site-specific recombinase XerD